VPPLSLLPENVIPSAGASSAAFQSPSHRVVLVPESFRGGCSFGAGRLADLSRAIGYCFRAMILRIGIATTANAGILVPPPWIVTMVRTTMM